MKGPVRRLLALIALWAVSILGIVLLNTLVQELRAFYEYETAPHTSRALR